MKRKVAPANAAPTGQKSAPKKAAELNEQQLDKVSGGTGGLHNPGPVGPGRGG